MRYWIFQTNDRLRLLDNLLNDTARDSYKNAGRWLLQRYSHEVKSKDGVLIWLSGENAGIYQISRIVGNPILVSELPNCIEYIQEKKVELEKALKLIRKANHSESFTIDTEKVGQFISHQLLESFIIDTEKVGQFISRPLLESFIIDTEKVGQFISRPLLERQIKGLQDVISTVETLKMRTVKIEVERDLYSAPLLKATLQGDPILKSLRIIEEPRQTIYRITAEEWNRVSELAAVEQVQTAK